MVSASVAPTASDTGSVVAAGKDTVNGFFAFHPSRSIVTGWSPRFSSVTFREVGSPVLR
jgi:hypothetical protein